MSGPLLPWRESRPQLLLDPLRAFSSRTSNGPVLLRSSSVHTSTPSTQVKERRFGPVRDVSHSVPDTSYYANRVVDPTETLLGIPLSTTDRVGDRKG